MIRLGLFLYDHLARRKRLEGSHMVSLRGAPSADRCAKTIRLASLTPIAPSTTPASSSPTPSPRANWARRFVSARSFVAARREADRWIARVESAGGPEEIEARAIVNAAGPYVSLVAHDAAATSHRASTRDW